MYILKVLWKKKEQAWNLPVCANPKMATKIIANIFPLRRDMLEKFQVIIKVKIMSLQHLK